MTATGPLPALLAGLLAAAPSGPGLGGASGFVQEQVPGGPELVVLPVEGARSVSLRLIFRAGSAMDPAGKEGLAHLVEHVLMEGAPGRPRLLDEARGAGVRLEAFTSRDATYFVADGSPEAFWPVAARLLRSVTSPAFPRQELELQLDVVRSEVDFHGEASEQESVLEQVLFPAPELGPLGEGQARLRIARSDLVEWHQRNYLSSSATLVLAGAVTPEQARHLASTSFLLPPALPDETVPARPALPALPASLKVRSSLVGFIHGYVFEPPDQAACEGLADLVHLRMLLAMSVQQPLLADSASECRWLRGNLTLLAFGFSRTLDASDVPEGMARIFRDLSNAPASAREHQVLAQRARRSRELIRADPYRLADEATHQATIPGASGRSRLPLAQPPVTAPRDLREAAQRHFVPEREIRLTLSPLEG